MSSELPLLQSRIERLERSNRRLRTGAIGAFLGLLALLTLGLAQSGDVLSAEEFRLVQDGVVRANLYADGDEVGLALRDEAGNERLLLQATELESILSFFDAKETKQVVLTTGHNDHGLYFMDPAGKDKVALIALDQAQGLYLIDREAGDTVSLVHNPEDSGLYFRGDRGLYVTRDGEQEELRLVTKP